MGICVLGLGYVGLTLAVTLAKAYPVVYGIDTDKNKIARLSRGELTIFEPGLNNLLKQVINEGTLKFSETITDNIVKNVDSFIICIGTPIDDNTKKPVFLHLEKVVKELTPFLKRGDLIVIRSTVTVGIARNFVKKFIEQNKNFTLGKDFFLSSAPERTVEGNALKELRELPQIIGSIDEESVNKSANIFNKITKTVIRVSSFEAAEIIKLLDNTSRDVNIALANIYGLICEKLGLQSKEIIEAANYAYPRNKIFIAGAGVGGQCLVKDPYFLIESVKDNLDLSFIKLAREINDSMPNHVKELIKEVYTEIKKQMKGSKILILGFAFKGTPATDDIRYSPTLPILDFLKENQVEIIGYDPNVNPEMIRSLGITQGMPENLSDLDCIVLMNNNKQFSELDYEKIIKNSSKPMGIVDGWQLLDPSYIRKLGFVYRGIGMS